MSQHTPLKNCNTHPKAEREYFHSQTQKWYAKQFPVTRVG